MCFVYMLRIVIPPMKHTRYPHGAPPHAHTHTHTRTHTHTHAHTHTHTYKHNIQRDKHANKTDKQKIKEEIPC